jgi:hypothetical protein
MLCRIKACSDPISVRVPAPSNWCDRASTTQNGSVKHFMAVNLVVRTSIEAYRGKFTPIVAAESIPGLIPVSFLAGIPVCLLTATICFAHSNHCHHILQTQFSYFSARLLQTGFWTKGTATICFTPIARIWLKSHVHLATLSGEKTRRNHLGESLAGILGGKNVGTP